ncbi:hypothetical protein L9F63_024430, partial [Diploptera punctata]
SYKSDKTTGVSQTEDVVSGSNVSTLPYFDFNVPRNVTTAVGQTAFLHCRVEQLGDKGDPRTTCCIILGNIKAVKLNDRPLSVHFRESRSLQIPSLRSLHALIPHSRSDVIPIQTLR